MLRCASLLRRTWAMSSMEVAYGQTPAKCQQSLKYQPQRTLEMYADFWAWSMLSKFAPHLAETTQPIRELLTKEKAWVWEDGQKRAFTKIKEALVASPVLSLFDPNLETIISGDASLFGLGAVLKQRQKTGELKPVAYVSMTPTEMRYAQIEKEALAFTWVCE